MNVCYNLSWIFNINKCDNVSVVNCTTSNNKEFGIHVSGINKNVEIKNCTDHFGVSIAQVDFYVTENTTLGHLISEINDAFDGRAKAVLENGKIVFNRFHLWRE